jgi:hypothetical protein
MIMRKGKNMIETNETITTDTEGIYMRDFKDTQVPRTFELKGGVQAHTSVTFDVYQYAHNPMELYEANQEQPAFVLNDYLAPDGEYAMWKGIPMRLRWNAVVRAMMITGNFRIKYRGCSKPQYGYDRKQNYCLAEYADTFAIYPK